MSVLAMELSSTVNSVAVAMPDGSVIERSWAEDRSKGNPLYEQLEAVREEAGIRWEDLRAIVVGRGPGQYSGMRAAAAAAYGFAMPGDIPVHGVSSGAALGYRVLKEGDHPVVAVIGDARREQWWMGCYRLEEDTLHEMISWTLFSPEELGNAIREAGAVAVTSDWTRKSELLLSVLGPEGGLTQSDVFPSAGDLLRLYAHREDADAAHESPLPIYLHPAVSPAQSA